MNLPFGVSVHSMPRQDPAEAILRFRLAIAAAPADPQAHLQLAANLHTAGELEEAEAEYKETIRLLDSSSESQANGMFLGLACCQLGCLLKARSMLKEARHYLERALTIYSTALPDRWPDNIHAKRAQRELKGLADG